VRGSSWTAQLVKMKANVIIAHIFIKKIKMEFASLFVEMDIKQRMSNVMMETFKMEMDVHINA
jgi:hypothetical protein